MEVWQGPVCDSRGQNPGPPVCGEWEGPRLGTARRAEGQAALKDPIYCIIWSANSFSIHSASVIFIVIILKYYRF